MNMTEINARLKKNDLIIIPVGSTNVMAPHNPSAKIRFW